MITAAKMPIIDYHCHLPPQLIAEDHRFANLYEIWLKGDHYKWRAMRSNGVDERFCTGDADDYAKFEAWARTVPHTIGNPLYHWTHLELKRPFGITGQLLGPQTAQAIWHQCNDKLAQPDFSARGIMKQMNVKMVGTTDDPVDDLRHHAAAGQTEPGPLARLDGAGPGVDHSDQHIPAPDLSQPDRRRLRSPPPCHSSHRHHGATSPPQPTSLHRASFR